MSVRRLPEYKPPPRVKRRCADAGRGFVVVLPGRMGGKPTIGHSRLPTETIAGMVAGGSSVAEVIGWYDYLSEDDVRVACWYEARYNGMGGKAWQKWWRRPLDGGEWTDPPEASR